MCGNCAAKWSWYKGAFGGNSTKRTLLSPDNGDDLIVAFDCLVRIASIVQLRIEVLGCAVVPLDEYYLVVEVGKPFERVLQWLWWRQLSGIESFDRSISRCSDLLDVRRDLWHIC